MRDFHNIEKSGFHKGEYVGYAAGRVYRIKRDGARWFAMNQDGTFAGSYFSRRTLQEMSEALETTAAYLLSAETV